MSELPKQSFAEMAVFLFEQTRREISPITELSVLAIKIGLEEDTCARMIADAQHQADLMYAAHQFFKIACEREAQIRAIFMQPQPASNDNVGSFWHRAIWTPLREAFGR